MTIDVHISVTKRNKAKWQKGTRLHEKLTYVIYVFETITCEETNMNCFWMHFFFAILCCISYFLETSKRRNVFIIEWWCNYSTSRFQFQGNRKIRRLLPSQKYLKLKIFSRVNQSSKRIKNQEEENKGPYRVSFFATNEKLKTLI